MHSSTPITSPWPRGTVKYLLRPAKVVDTDVKSATATIWSSGGGSVQISTGQWEVLFGFTGKG
jgi:preprotein translocase subunit SecD